MPKRTNPFQQLVTLIQEALAPTGATVTPSAMVPGRTSGNLREIDVLVQASVGPYLIKIAVEAKDEGRKIDASKIESIIGKYRGSGALQVNKIVVVARNGFTPEAITRAQDEDIELLTLDEATICPWCQLVPQSFHLHFPPLPVGFDLDPKLPKSVLESNWLNEGKFVCLCHGYDYGTPRFWMQQFLFHHILPNPAIINKMHDVAVTGRTGRSELSFRIPLSNRVLRCCGTDFPAKTATMRYQYVHAKGEMTSALYKMENATGEPTTMVHSEGIVGGHIVKMLIPLDKPDSRGVLEVEALPPSSKGPMGSSWTLKNGVWIEKSTSERKIGCLV